MKQRQTSYAFLMEMLWVSGFFILAACVFIMVFVKADRMSRDADELNQAVLAAETAMEDTFSAYPDLPSEQPFWPVPADSKDRTDEPENVQKGVIYYSGDWQPINAGSSEEAAKLAAFRLTITLSLEEQMLDASVLAEDKNGSPIYTLNGSHYIP